MRRPDEPNAPGQAGQRISSAAGGLQVSEVACCARGLAEQVFGFIGLARVPRVYGVLEQGPDWFAEQLLRGEGAWHERAHSREADRVGDCVQGTPITSNSSSFYLPGKSSTQAAVPGRFPGHGCPRADSGGVGPVTDGHPARLASWRQLVIPDREETMMHPMFKQLFLQTDADDLLAEEDRRRRVSRARRAKSAAIIRPAAHNGQRQPRP